MDFEEGSLYQGRISLSGGEGPERRWIVVAPFGKKHLHSVDEPLELHCWPLSAAETGLDNGRLHYEGNDPEHPVIQLQRLKEQNGVHDVHLALDERMLARLFALLDEAVRADRPYAPYLGGEILAFGERSVDPVARRAELRERVSALLNG